MGSGFRTFTAGEVLTASNVQNYLMDQSVMVFGGSAARSSAIGTANFEEGMVSYLTDTDKVEAYNGTNWVSVAPTTSQGLTLINTTSFSGVSSQSVSDVFSETYTSYKIIVRITDTASDGFMNLRFRVSGTDTSSANYSSAYYGVSATYSADVGGNSAQTAAYVGYSENANEFAFSAIELVNPFLTQPTIFNSIGAYKTAANNITILNAGGGLDNTTSYTGFTLLMPGGGNATGVIHTYGYNL